MKVSKSSGGSSKPRSARQFHLDPGEYSFEVVEAVEKQSKAGNDMIEVNLRFIDGFTAVNVKDWLVSKVSWKVEQFMLGIGMKDVFESGEVSPDMLIGRGGVAELGIREHEGKFYNEVGKYIDPAEGNGTFTKEDDVAEDPFA